MDNSHFWSARSSEMVNAKKFFNEMFETQREDSVVYPFNPICPLTELQHGWKNVINAN